jgi:2-methylcitrate dehydratase PrpD
MRTTRGIVISGAAHAILHGDVFVDAFSEKEINNPLKRELMAKVTVDIDPSLPVFDEYTTEITLRDGQKLARIEDAVPGSVKNPLG